MNTLSESIRAVFKPETAFTISLHNTNEERDCANQTFTPYRLVLPTEDEVTRRGIPESTLHDYTSIKQPSSIANHVNQSRHLEKLEHFKAYNPTAAQLRIASEREVEDAETLTCRQRVVCLVCCLIAAGIMIETLFFKFTAAPESVYIFKRMGTEPWMRWVQGLWELTASIALLLPRLRWAGGILTTGAMAAAILSHMTWLGYSIQGDHGLLFCMALVTFTCGVTVMWTYRHHIPGYVPATLY